MVRRRGTARILVDTHADRQDLTGTASREDLQGLVAARALDEVALLLGFGVHVEGKGLGAGHAVDGDLLQVGHGQAGGAASRLCQRYQQATVRCGRQDRATRCIRSGLGIARIR